MRRKRFTLAGVHSLITNGLAFQFDMSDIPRIRGEFGVLIDNLSVIYFQRRPVSSPDDDDVMVQNSAGVYCLEDDSIQSMIEESFYSSLEDHGGKQKQSTLPKHSPRRRKDQNHKRERQREHHPKLNIFSSGVHKPPKKKHSGQQKMYNRICGRNARNMHLRVPKKERTDAQEKESRRAKIVDRELRKHPASPGDIGQIIAAAVGISASQVSEYESGEIQDNQGIEFCSQEGLLLAERFVLSLEEE